jgi:hypothetical protein
MVTKAQLAKVKKKAKKKVAKKRAPRRKTNGRATIRIDRELFCKELIKNSMNATSAYKAVSPKVTMKTAAANGHKMLRETETINLLTPMLQELFIDAGIEANYVFKRWVEMSQASPLDYFEIDPDGRLGQMNLNGITEAQRLNLTSIKVDRSMVEKTDDDGNVTHTLVHEKIDLKVADQQKAVDTIAKHLGLLIDKMAEEDVERLGDLIEKGVGRIRASKDLEGWRSIFPEGHLIEGD